MNAQLNALRFGFVRGWIEFKHTFRNGQDLWAYLFPAVLLLVVMFFMRNATVPVREAACDIAGEISGGVRSADCPAVCRRPGAVMPTAAL